MKRIIIRNRQAVITHMGEAENADAWIAAIEPTKAWGLPQRDKWKDQCSAEELLESNIEMDVPSKKYFFLDGEVEFSKFEQDCSEAEKLRATRFEDSIRVQVTFPAQYTITIEDMQAEIDALNAKKEAIATLRQRVKTLANLSDLTTAQIKEALMKFLKMMDLGDKL